jgi:hypothetical protein
MYFRLGSGGGMVYTEVSKTSARKACEFESRPEHLGQLAEWSNAAVLKTAVPKGTESSNPSLSVSSS